MADTLDLGNLLVHLNMNASQYFAMMKKVEAQMKITSQKLTHIGRQMSLRVTAPIVLMGGAATKAFASFDDAMTKSLAIMSGITPQLRKEMENLALDISNKGVTSAKDLARSYFFLASAGLDARQSMASLGVVERFAVAGAFDMALATDLATDAQSALGLTVRNARQNMINMTRVTDVLTGANTLANATTEQFSLALTSQAGPAMKAYGIELEEGVAVLAAYADQGIKAQTAGNMFSRMLRLMTKGFLDNENAWKRLNINIFDAVGNLKPMSDIIGDLTNALGDMAPKQKIVTLQMLGFQARSQQAILPLLGLQNRIKEYNIKLKQMQGITREIAEKQLKSFSSQMKILWNQIKNVGIEIGTILSPAILSLNGQIKTLIQSWKELNDVTKKWVLIVAGVAAVIGPVLIAVGLFMKLITFMVPVLLTVILAMNNLYLALGALLIFHPVAVMVLLLVGRLTQLAFQYNKIKVNFIKLNPFILKSNELLREHKKVWDDISKAIKETSEGRIIAAQMKIISRQLSDKLDQLKFFKAEFERLNVIDRWLQGPILQTGINRLQLEIGVLQQRFETLGTQGEQEFKRIEEVAIEAARAAAEILEGKEKEFELFDFDKDKFIDSVQEWVDAARDISTNLAEAFTSGLDEISKGLAELVMTGEADFRAIAESVFQNVLQVMIQSIIAAAVQPLMAGLGMVKTGEETVTATMNQATATMNQATAVVNQTSAAANSTSAAANSTSAAANSTSAITNQAASGVMQIASIANGLAGAEMSAAAGTMLIAAYLMAAGSATGGVAAKGVVMQGGSMTSFARGDIVKRPTLFPMTNGTGLMGEVGPEAIVPLRRTDDGRLGIEAMGGEGANINIINVLDKSEMLAALSGTAGEKAVINIIKRNKGIVSGVLG